MVGSVIQAAGHDPRAGFDYVEKIGFGLPPRRFFFLRLSQPLPAVLRVTVDEVETRFRLRKRRRSHVNCQHSAKPKILADALVDHLFAYAAAAWISAVRTDNQVVVAKFAPDTENFDAFRLISFDEKVIEHRHSLRAATGLACRRGQFASPA